MSKVNNLRLFTASCFALVTTAFAFAIRAGILDSLSKEFTLSDTQLGYINQMAILGFPIATIVGGYLYNVFGAKRMIVLALVSHLLGILLTIYASGFYLLLISNFFIGFGNGTVEAACNPMIAAMFRKNQTTMLNRFHVWFPGGIFLGALISKFMTDSGMSWQAQIAVMLIPTAIYAYLFYGQKFPEAKDAGQAKFSDNLKGMLNPVYILLLVCMILTANTELSTQQWVERLLGASGASPMLILAMVTGLMAVGRFFAGPVVHRLNPTGVLWASAVIATLGIYMMGHSSGAMVYVSAIMFAIGVCYFWPTMIGTTSEYVPQSGALGMSIMGGMGMFATGIAQPIVGGWIDSGRAAAQAQGLVGDAAEMAAGQATLGKLIVFPIILIFAFGVLWFMLRGKPHGAAAHA
ncbi:MAG: MFS transporter [Lewinellaceae bacterium]|nr:MFS transporter [Lewinellaceae bacterium]